LHDDIIIFLIEMHFFFFFSSSSSPSQCSPACRSTIIFHTFAAAWCPPCQQFTPLLKDFYKACKDDPDIHLEVIYVSSDRDLKEFEDYYSKMPWLALESQHYKSIASKKCHISGIPALVVLDGEGKFVTDRARGAVSAAKGNPSKVKALVTEWNEINAVPLEEAAFSNTGGCQIL